MRTTLALLVALLAVGARAQTTNDIFSSMPLPDMPTVLTNGATNVVNSTNYVRLLPGVKNVEAWFSGQAITNTSAADVDTAAIALSPDAVVWTTRATSATVQLTQSGTNMVANHTNIDVAGARFMKLLQAEEAGTNRLTNAAVQLVPR